ncbi:MAG: hypothetical protein OHK0046_11990 [Anaerolineae bacterium]
MDENISLHQRQEVAALLANLSAALSHPARLMILSLLAGQARNVTELTQKLEISQPSASRHLKILLEQRLVASERDGQHVVYRLTDARILEALRILREIVVDMLNDQGTLADTMREQDLL